MRKRVGNPFGEAHGQGMRVYDWIAPAEMSPAAIPALIESVVAGLKCFHRGDGEQNACVNTSRRPDGSLYVALCLYDAGCDGVGCGQNHTDNAGRPIRQTIAPAVTEAQIVAIKARVGEHARHRLTDGRAGSVLKALGFQTRDEKIAAGTPASRAATDAPLRED